MKTIEIFAEAVKFASEASDIPIYRILSESRDADVVDANIIHNVVYLEKRTTLTLFSKSASILCL